MVLNPPQVAHSTYRWQLLGCPMVGTMLGPPRGDRFSAALPRVLKLRSQEDPSRCQPCIQSKQLLQRTGDQTRPDSAMATTLATLMVNVGAKGARCPAGV